MENKYSLIMLIMLVSFTAILLLKRGREKSENNDTSKVPILGGALIGLFSGVLVCLLSDKYLLPQNWWYNSDVGRDVELTVLGGFFGMILGGIGAVVFFSWKSFNKSK